MRKIASIIRGLSVPDSIPSWAFGPPVNYEKLVGRASVLAAFGGTGWKACATNFFQGGALLVTAFSEKARNNR